MPENISPQANLLGSRLVAIARSSIVFGLPNVGYIAGLDLGDIDGDGDYECP
jgi:hypothetical protein